MDIEWLECDLEVIDLEPPRVDDLVVVENNAEAFFMAWFSDLVQRVESRRLSVTQ